MFIFEWLNGLGKAFGVIADDVDEAREEIEKSPIINEHRKQIARDNPPNAIKHVRQPDDEEG